MAWRADSPTHDLVCSPLVSVHSWFRLPNPDGFFIQRLHLFIPLSFAPSQSVTQLCLSAWSVNADLCSMLVEHLLVSRLKRLVVMVSLLFCVHLVSCQMSFLFRRCNTCCRSYRYVEVSRNYSLRNHEICVRNMTHITTAPLS